MKTIKLGIAFTALALCSCAGRQVDLTKIQPGMPKAEVIEAIGPPTGYEKWDSYEALIYSQEGDYGINRDYKSVILKEGIVVEYGHGRPLSERGKEEEINLYPNP